MNDVVCAGAAAARLRASRFCGSLAPMLAADTERGCVLRVLRRSLPRTDSAEVHAMHACYLRAFSSVLFWQERQRETRSKTAPPTGR